MKMKLFRESFTGRKWKVVRVIAMLVLLVLLYGLLKACFPVRPWMPSIPQKLSLTSPIYTNAPLLKQVILDYLEEEKPRIIDELLQHEAFAAYRAEDLRFASDSFRWLTVWEDRSEIDRGKDVFPILHGQQVVAMVEVGQLNWNLYLPDMMRLNDLLRQYEPSELAIVDIGYLAICVLTPDGVLHPFNGGEDWPESIPRQSDEYYKLFHTEDNRLKGID